MAGNYEVIKLNTDPNYPHFYAVSTMVDPLGTWDQGQLPQVDDPPIHFSNTSQMIIGTRFGEKMLEVLPLYE
jgi:hypothetical protein